MKKYIFASLMILMLSATAVNAENWKDSFTTRLMKLMTTDPSYTDVVLTDIDQNGVPEAFLLKKGTNGHILNGITLKNNVLTTLEAPKNVTGACLEDITVYDCGGKFVYVGKEVSRYATKINYYELSLSGDNLVCTEIEKSKYSDFPAIAYKDFYSDNLHTTGYPNRTKIEEFLNGYEVPTEIAVKATDAALSVDGNSVNISGFNINGSNYYKIRDVALILRGTNAKFSVEWNSELGAIEIETGERYKAIGNELESVESATNIKAIQSKLFINGEAKSLEAYSIDDNTYFKIRDIGDFAGFETGWNSATSTVTLTTN